MKKSTSCAKRRPAGIISFYAVSAAIALLIGSCASTKGGADTAELGGADSSGTITIASIGTLSGEAASFGVSAKNGAAMAAEEWNASGGVFDGKKVKMVFEDDKGEPSEAAKAYSKVIQQDHAAAIIGTIMSKCTLAGAPIAQAAGVPMISPTSTNEKITLVGDYIYRACFIDPFQGVVGAKFAFNDLKTKSAGVLFDAGSDYCRGQAEAFKPAFEKLGGKVVAYEGHSSGAKDFTAQLARIVMAKPDVMFVPDYYNDVARITRQARELGFYGPMVGGDGWDSPDLAKLGGSAVENGFFVNHYSSAAPRPEVQNFVNAYKGKFGREPDALAALAYDAVYIMLNAIRTARSTNGSEVRDALAAMNLDLVSGHISFDTNRNPIKSAVIIEIKGGKQVYRTTIDP
jgi:branched-chain amino acid transport system substrate-binding protein